MHRRVLLILILLAGVWLCFRARRTAANVAAPFLDENAKARYK